MPFGIKDLERFSGVKAHTIRTWEHRYGVPKPDYKIGATRFYTLEELKLVLDLALLNQNGYKISTLAKFSKEEIVQKLKSLINDEDNYCRVINELFVKMYQLEVRDFESILDQCFITWRADIVIGHIIVPFLKKVNLFWQGNRLTEEHLVVTVLRKKLLHAIEKIDVPLLKDRKILLFLTGSRQLDLALLYASFYIRQKGIEVIYMGNDVSMDNLSFIIDTIQPDLLYTYVPRKTYDDFEKQIRLLQPKLPACNIVVSVYPIRDNKEDSKYTCFMQLDQALDYLCG